MVQAQEEAGPCPTQKSSLFLLWAAKAKEAQVSQQVCAKTFCRCSLDKSALLWPRKIPELGLGTGAGEATCGHTGQEGRSGGPLGAWLPPPPVLVSTWHQESFKCHRLELRRPGFKPYHYSLYRRVAMVPYMRL